MKGTAVRNKIKGTGLKMEEVAERLGMTPQGLNYHLNKPTVDDKFIALIYESVPELGTLEVKVDKSQFNEEEGVYVTMEKYFTLQMSFKIKKSNRDILSDFVTEIEEVARKYEIETV